MATDRIRALGDRLWGSFTAAAGGTSPENQELEDDGLEMQVCERDNFHSAIFSRGITLLGSGCSCSGVQGSNRVALQYTKEYILTLVSMSLWSSPDAECQATALTADM